MLVRFLYIGSIIRMHSPIIITIPLLLARTIGLFLLVGKQRVSAGMELAEKLIGTIDT